MNFSEVSTSKLHEISQGYQLSIDSLKRELDILERKKAILDEELSKRVRLDDIMRKIEEDSKSPRCLSGVPISCQRRRSAFGR